jgi:hypothetical protein
MGAFKINNEPRGQVRYLEFHGNIDEDAVFSNLQVAGDTEITLDLEHVTGVNSCGIREWMKWLKTIPAGVKLNYVNCPKLIVDQMNMVAGFFPPGSTVESFYVPYYCESCSNETQVPFLRGKHFEGKNVTAPAEIKCQSCAETAEMDVIQAKYFKFLENQSK